MKKVVFFVFAIVSFEIGNASQPALNNDNPTMSVDAVSPASDEKTVEKTATKKPQYLSDLPNSIQLFETKGKGVRIYWEPTADLLYFISSISHKIIKIMPMDEYLKKTELKQTPQPRTTKKTRERRTYSFNDDENDLQFGMDGLNRSSKSKDNSKS